jgi:hypothetical protein
MSKAFIRLGLTVALSAFFSVACGAGESSSGFGQGVEAYQSPPATAENGSQPPNNLLACEAESSCQGCETACHLCECRFSTGQLDDTGLLACIAAPACAAVVREAAQLESGSNYGPEAQFLGSGERQVGGNCEALVEDGCAYCMCVDIGDCSAFCADGS